MGGHDQRGDGGVERVVARDRQLPERGIEPGVSAVEERGPLADVGLHDGTGTGPRVDLDHQRRAGVVERPDGEAFAPEAGEHRPAADRTRTHAAVAADLERRLGADPAVPRDRRFGDPQVRGEIGTGAARSSPERGLALREPAVAVADRRRPQVVDRRQPLRGEEPRRQREREVEADHQIGVGGGEVDDVIGHFVDGSGRPPAGPAHRRRPRPTRSSAARPACVPTSRPRRPARTYAVTQTSTSQPPGPAVSVSDPSSVSRTASPVAERAGDLRGRPRRRRRTRARGAPPAPRPRRRARGDRRAAPRHAGGSSLRPWPASPDATVTRPPPLRASLTSCCS